MRDHEHSSIYSEYAGRRLNRLFLSLLIGLASLLCAPFIQAAPLFSGASQIVVFGDSASSIEMNGAEYRYTNDLVWAEYLGNALHLQTAIYAQAGGYTIDNATRFSLFRQMDNYYADHGGSVDPNAVHFVYIGSNDGLAPEESHKNRQRAMNDLIARGATKIVLVNLPSIWQYSSSDLQQYVPSGVKVWNMMDVLSDLDTYGIDSTQRFCQLDPDTCDNALLWDGTHPASGLHKAFAQHMQATLVPVPATVWLFGSALVGLVGVRRR